MVSLRQILVVSTLAVASHAADHIITALPGNTFDPNSITAAEGDRLVFQFQGANHSVVSSSFDKPCEPTTGGFFGGWSFATSGTTLSENQFTVEVTNASKPIWFYCPQGRHCASGMVGVVNPPTGRTVEDYADGASRFEDPGVAPATVDGGTVEPVSAAGAIARMSTAAIVVLAGLAAWTV